MLHLVGLTLIYLSKMHGHSNMKFKNIYSIMKFVIYVMMMRRRRSRRGRRTMILC